MSALSDPVGRLEPGDRRPDNDEVASSILASPTAKSLVRGLRPRPGVPASCRGEQLGEQWDSETAAAQALFPTQVLAGPTAARHGAAHTRAHARAARALRDE